MGAKSNQHLKFSITSGKGGVGKTSIAVNLAYALARRDLRVLLVDGDLGLANVDVLLGLSVKKTIRDILEHGSDPLDSVIYLDRNLGILPASSGFPEMAVLGTEDHHQLEDILNSISTHFNYVLLDTAAGIGPSVLWMNKFVDHNIVVLNPDPTSVTDAYALIKVLSTDYKIRRFHLLLNAVRSEKEGEDTYRAVKTVAEKFLNLDIRYFGAIPEDKVVQRAVREQLPFVQKVPHSKAARAVFALADRMQKAEYRIQNTGDRRQNRGERTKRT